MPNKAPIFVEQPFLWSAVLTNQVLDRPGTTGAAVLMGTISGAGGLVESVWCIPQGNFSENVVRLFVQRAGLNANILIREQAIAAVGGTTNTAAAAMTPIQLPEVLADGQLGLRLNPGDRLFAALGTASGIGLWVIAQGGHYEVV